VELDCGSSLSAWNGDVDTSHAGRSTVRTAVVNSSSASPAILGAAGGDADAFPDNLVIKGQEVALLVTGSDGIKIRSDSAAVCVSRNLDLGLSEKVRSL
jgi:hypothetical protein